MKSRATSVESRVNVVLFSGGRGSQVLSEDLIANPRIQLTLAINGYDDGLSTGAVRRFLGDSLGPSDFRKNASRMARALSSCAAELIEVLDLRLPLGADAAAVAACRQILGGVQEPLSSEFEQHLATLAAGLPNETAALLTQRLELFEQERQRQDADFPFSDCSVGNLLFAGCFLEADRDFNRTVDAYCDLLGLPEGLIQNVTDGTDAYLVAVTQEGRLLASEAELVDANQRHRIADIYLIDRPVSDEERAVLDDGSSSQLEDFLAEHACDPPPNRLLLDRLATADLIIYAPGTQHSSLFPSYLTAGVGPAIARNLTAIKLLITNIQQDVEIPDASALDIVDRALYYLREKNKQSIESPCLITHYLTNDPERVQTETPYVPLGRLQNLEDPRLIRIGNFEDGSTGRHHSERILTPFLTRLLDRDRRPRVAVLLFGTRSRDKLTQSLLEALRGGLDEVAADITFFYATEQSLAPDFARSLPFDVDNVWRAEEAAAGSLLGAIRERPFDYVVLFESSGMYRGEEIANLVSLATVGRHDAVWGSRRLSIRDVHESYKFRYRKNPLLGAVSYAGSHLLSLTYLALYGRYISDTLSGVYLARASYLREYDVDLEDPCLNHRLLSIILSDRAEIFESPIRFFPISPERVKRTSVADGLRAISQILWWRWRAPRADDRQRMPGGAGDASPRQISA